LRTKREPSEHCVIDFNTPPAHFDEAAYLAANRDVADAVVEGRLSSGWQHVLLQGCREPRPALSASLKAEVIEYWRTVYAVMPPPDLRERVHGSRDALNFHLAGVQISADLDRVLARHDSAVPRDPSVLDFGCGCGRVVWHLNRRHPSWTIVGRDIDAQAIGWCRRHLHTFGNFDTIEHWPPIPLESAAFDLIYAISVFTHLDEDMQFAWLKELRRLSRRGGLLLLSVHPIELAAGEIDGQMRKKGFVYAIGKGTSGLPNFYQTTFHSRAYVIDNWSRYFDIVDVLERAINNHQDLVVARRRDD
jgi:SAM-dependent methyltransferase